MTVFQDPGIVEISSGEESSTGTQTEGWGSEGYITRLALPNDRDGESNDDSSETESVMEMISRNMGRLWSQVCIDTEWIWGKTFFTVKSFKGSPGSGNPDCEGPPDFGD